MLKIQLKTENSVSYDNIIIRLLSAWCLSSVLFNFSAGTTLAIDHAAGMGILTFAAVFGGCFAAVWLTGFILKRKKIPEAFLLVFNFSLYSFLTMLEAESWYYYFIIAALFALLFFYLSQKGYLSGLEPVSDIKKWGLVFCMFLAFTFAVGGTSVIRYKTYSAPNYDFGIFCNMFYNMRKSFLPFTTCERDMVLSHFAIHVSPIFYVLLPLYWFFPSPVTLEIVQPVILASAVFPALLLAKKFGLSNRRTVILCFITLFHPAVVSGTNYDLHENCFLFPLLLWVFYAFETERTVLLAVMTVLTLTVKEDAAVYIVFFALYVFLGRKKQITGSFLAAGALVYFFIALFLLTLFGNGVMSNRYENYLPEGGTLFEVVKNVFIDPGYVFTQLFIDNKGDTGAKLLFILQMFAPLAFMPFAVKNVSELLLILPMILMNLMPVYPYQYDIGFQYHYGVLAFLVYLSVINLSRMRKTSAKTFLCTGAVITAVLFTAAAFPRTMHYIEKITYDGEACRVMDEALEQIPDDASVICSTYLLPKLSERDVIYEDWYHTSGEEENADYVILDLRYDYKKYEDIYRGLGYTDTQTVSYEGNALLLIMQKPVKGENDAAS